MYVGYNRQPWRENGQRPPWVCSVLQSCLFDRWINSSVEFYSLTKAGHTGSTWCNADAAMG
jgi:hypothetical protein